jgi:hypothetical protein
MQKVTVPLVHEWSLKSEVEAAQALPCGGIKAEGKRRAPTEKPVCMTTLLMREEIRV